MALTKIYKKPPPVDRNRDKLGRFGKGHPGKLPGTRNMTVLLKEKLLEYALTQDLDEVIKKIDGQGNEITKRSFSKSHLMTLAATFVPKETALKVTRTTRTLVDINIKKTTDGDLNDKLLNALSQRGGGQIIEGAPAEIVDGSSE